MVTRSLAFMDESGILSGDAQRFFCLGLMKTQACGQFCDAAHRIYDGAVSGLPAGACFEFKFTAVTKDASLKPYLALIDAYFAQPERFFCAFVIDKQRPGVNWKGYFPSVWDAYIGYSKMFVRNNVGSDEEVCLIADYLGKPKASPRYFESELSGLMGNAGPDPGRVFNACMLDSCSSLMIQTVDLLLGGVRYAFLRDREPDAPHDEAKDAVVERIREHVGRPSLAVNLTNPAPQYFSVWEFHP